MAQLRTIGLYIESSGLDDVWTESDIYGPATVKQILEGKNMKRGLEAHVTTLQALFSLYAEEFFIQHPKLKEDLQSHVKAIDEAWEKGEPESVRTAHSELTKLLESSNVTKKLNEFDKTNEESSPVFKFARQYMHMVQLVLLFIKAVRNADWDSHLSSLEAFKKYFFSYDKLNNTRMILLYLAEMKESKHTDPFIWEEFQSGNWVANKTSIPFCAIGADYGLEHLNRGMTVAGGLVGISLN